MLPTIAIPNILDVAPHRPFQRHDPSSEQIYARLDDTRPEAKAWRNKYIAAWRRSKRFPPGSRRWLHHRRQMVRYRRRVEQHGHRIMASAFELVIP